MTALPYFFASVKKMNSQGVTLLFVFFILLTTAKGFTQTISPERMDDRSGTYRKTTHNTKRNLSSADNAKTAQMMDAVVDVLKKAYPQPIGAEIGPYGGIWEDYRGNSEFANGPYSVYLTIPFYDLYKSKSGVAEANGEYESSIDIWINSARYILQANPVINGNDRIFRLPWPGIAVNGFPKYNNMILVVPNEKRLPWRPATKQEYLENVIASLKAHLLSTSLQAERDKVTTAEQMLASMSSSEKKQIAYLKKSKYLYSEYGYDKWTGFTDASDTTAEQLVTIDENFYDNTLPRNSYQLMVIERKIAPASRSAARPSERAKKEYNDRHEKLNNIVHLPGFLTDLRSLLGKNGMDIAAHRPAAKSEWKFVAPKINQKEMDRKIDSMFRNYTLNLPSMPSSSPPATGSETSPPIDVPSRNDKKLTLASRKLETKQDVINYIDELDQKLSSELTGTTAYADANSNSTASYGSWLLDNPRRALFFAIKAAKQQPDNDCALNNLGATLGLCGIEYLAVPLYIVCLKKEPGNSTITNNLGQAYLSMGDLQQAQSYLQSAVGTTPYHHHANNSLGRIYEIQGKKQQAITCYENSLRGSFTLTGYNRLKALKRESALKLMDLIRHRYKRPDYINFNKYPIPDQCRSVDVIEKRKAEHKAYQKIIDDQITIYTKRKIQQEPLAQKSLEEVAAGKRKNAIIRKFQPFATAVLVSVRHDFEDRLQNLEKELREIDREKARLQFEYEAAMKQMEDSFEPRLDKVGEGNPDLALDEEMCEAKNGIANHYLPLMADCNDKRFTKIIHAYKDYLNDYLYWIKLASFTDEIYQLEYDELILMMLRVLQKVQLTTINDYCASKDEFNSKNPGISLNKPPCPLPNGLEIPLIVAKIKFDCDSWGVEGGEAIVGNIEHKIGGETTIALGIGGSFYSTPKIGGNLSPGVDAGAKEQFFITFDGSSVSDWGLLWEAEISANGFGKSYSVKQNFTWGVIKGFNVKGELTDEADKRWGVKEDKQVNKHVGIYNPKQN